MGMEETRLVFLSRSSFAKYPKPKNYMLLKRCCCNFGKKRNCPKLHSERKDIESLRLLNEALEAQKMIVEKIQLSKVPSLLLSYEKAFSLPENFLLSLAISQVCLIKMSNTRLLNMIQPNHRGYSLRARRESFGECAFN